MFPIDFVLQVANSTSPMIQSSGAVEHLSSSTDPTSAILGASGIAAGIGGAIKSLFTDKHQKQSEKEIDFDQEEYRRLRNIEDKYTLSNPTKTRAEILLMPAYPDEPTIKTSLAEAYAKDYKGYKDYNTKKYYQK